jgi:hypothetical protein
MDVVGDQVFQESVLLSQIKRTRIRVPVLEQDLEIAGIKITVVRSGLRPESEDRIGFFPGSEDNVITVRDLFILACDEDSSYTYFAVCSDCRHCSTSLKLETVISGVLFRFFLTYTVLYQQ